jgi:hypothetical protein
VQLLWALLRQPPILASCASADIERGQVIGSGTSRDAGNSTTIAVGGLEIRSEIPVRMELGLRV